MSNSKLGTTMQSVYDAIKPKTETEKAIMILTPPIYLSLKVGEAIGRKCADTLGWVE